MTARRLLVFILSVRVPFGELQSEVVNSVSSYPD